MRTFQTSVEGQNTYCNCACALCIVVTMVRPRSVYWRVQRVEFISTSIEEPVVSLRFSVTKESEKRRIPSFIVKMSSILSLKRMFSWKRHFSALDRANREDVEGIMVPTKVRFNVSCVTSF